MSDLISRQAAIDAAECIVEHHAITPYKTMAAAMDHLKRILNGMPSAQPEIIACGDCKHWIYHDRRCVFWNHGVKPLDWCSYAERRTDGRYDLQAGGD